MGPSPQTPRWTRHFFYRSEHTRTTWKFRIGFITLTALMAWSTRACWSDAIADSLVCDATVAPSDAILVENFDPTYLTFETAARLRHAGVASRVLVPVAKSGDAGVSRVSQGVAELMADIAHLGSIEVVPIREVEPISLNAAADILQFMDRERIRSVVVVSPLFRSKRSALVYGATLGVAGITVLCEPSRGGQEMETWTDTWHGIQNVLEQFLKLHYYRLYVLPFRSSNHVTTGRS
jgi:hypothetical protein